MLQDKNGIKIDGQRTVINSQKITKPKTHINKGPINIKNIVDVIIQKDYTLI